MTYSTLYQICRNAGQKILESSEISSLCNATFGRNIRVYIGGIDTYIVQPGERYPYVLLSPNGSERTNGGRDGTITAEVAIDAQKADDTSKGVAVSGVCECGMGDVLGDLTNYVENIFWNGVGAIPDGSTTDFNLTGQYPIQSANIEFTFKDYETYNDTF